MISKNCLIIMVLILVLRSTQQGNPDICNPLHCEDRCCYSEWECWDDEENDDNLPKTCLWKTIKDIKCRTVTDIPNEPNEEGDVIGVAYTETIDHDDKCPRNYNCRNARCRITWDGSK